MYALPINALNWSIKPQERTVFVAVVIEAVSYSCGMQPPSMGSDSEPPSRALPTHSLTSRDRWLAAFTLSLLYFSALSLTAVETVVDPSALRRKFHA